MSSLAVVQEKPSVYVIEGSPKKKLPKGMYWRGNVIWVSYKTNQGRKQESTDTANIKDAETFLDDRKAAYRTGRLVFDNPKKVTFKDFVLEAIKAKSMSKKGGYTVDEALILIGKDPKAIRDLESESKALKYSNQKPRFKFKSARDYFRNLRGLLEVFGRREVCSITPDDVRDYIQRRKVSVSPATINRETCCLSDICKWGLDTTKYRNLSFRNPVSSKSHKQEEADPKQRYWTVEERQSFLNAVDEMPDLFFPAQLVKDISEWQWSTGLRIESSLLSKVGQVQLGLGKFGKLNLDSWQVKGGRKISHSLKNQKAVEIAKRNMAGKGPDDFLFEWAECKKRKNSGKKIEYDSFRRAFNLICSKAGIQNANVHSWKKTYAMDRAIEGADIMDLMTELQHKEVSTTMRYIDFQLVKEMREIKALS